MDIAEAIDEQTMQDEMAMWGAQVGPHPTNNASLVRSPKYQEIVSILHEQPLLVQPVLEWLRQMKAKMAMAQLQVLYTPDQIEEMTKQLS